MNTILDFVRREPAALISVVAAVLDALVSFGVPLTDAEKGSVVGVITVLAGLVIRSQVTPVASLPAAPSSPTAP